MLTLSALSLSPPARARRPATKPSSQPWLWNPEKPGDDRSADEEYFEKHIQHISDADVFDSLSLDEPKLAQVRAAAATSAVRDYFLSANGNGFIVIGSLNGRSTKCPPARS